MKQYRDEGGIQNPKIEVSQNVLECSRIFEI